MSTVLDVRTPIAHVPAVRARRSDFARRIIAVLVMFVGAAFVAMTLIVNLFSVGPAFERMTDGFRPVMTQQTIATARQDISGLAAAGTEVQTKLLPAVATQLKLSPQQMIAMMTGQFPEVVTGLGAMPTLVPRFDGLVTTLDQQRTLFASADAIPTKDLPATTLPWSLLAVGIVVFGIGVYTWYAPRAGSVVALVVGGALIAVPLILTLPQKAADADQLNTNLKPVYTQQMITQATGGLSTLSAMGRQMQEEMLPALATQLKMPPAQMQAFLQSYPATAAAMKNMPASLSRFQGLVGTFRTHLGDYDTLKPVELVPIVWMAIGGGIALVLIGGIGAWLARPGTGGVVRA